MLFQVAYIIATIVVIPMRKHFRVFTYNYALLIAALFTLSDQRCDGPGAAFGARPVSYVIL